MISFLRQRGVSQCQNLWIFVTHTMLCIPVIFAASNLLIFINSRLGLRFAHPLIFIKSQMPLVQACPEGLSAPASGGVVRTARTVSMLQPWHGTKLCCDEEYDRTRRNTWMPRFRNRNVYLPNTGYRSHAVSRGTGCHRIV
jgi:hypothetical protein